MADIGTVLGAAQTLFAALECSILKEVCSALGYRSQLEDLKSTVATVQSVLLDAAASVELTHAARDYIEKLKTAVYDADDLFDEFRTLAERKHHKLKEANHVFFEKVRLFFSSENSLKVAYKISREIKKIRKNLDGIARDHTNFGFAVDRSGRVVDNKRIRNRRQETCSYVYAPSVVGREADVEAIVDKLLDLNGQKGARFLTVVGIGGMGKTTLAQLVCADQRVKNEFSSNVWWVCVADQDNHQFDKKAILCTILELATGSKYYGLSLEQIQMKLRRELEGKKYLLVLDDLWNDDKVKWMELKDFLILGAAESRTLVTTRSHDVAKVIGESDKHVLEGLSDENSWCLFEVTAFDEKPDSQANPLPPEVEIGKKIVKQCSNVPLAIKVVGSLLCGQGLDKWKTCEKSGVGGIRKGDNQIMSILKFSYHNLDPSLKSCFGYCALFPKDYEIDKEMLIRHWMAQGYIVPVDRGQSIGEAGEVHFLILLRRCFFQDVKMDGRGNVKSFKMHDLIHDVAQEVAGHEMLVILSGTSNLGEKVRHVFGPSHVYGEDFYSNVKIRTYLRNGPGYTAVVPVDRVLTKGVCLRTLTLVNVGMETLPDLIGKLLHFRHLDLSHNPQLKTLPGSITKLHNLQTLKLKGCYGLTELPKQFSRFVNLMHLNIKGCDSIKYMPVGMDKLTSLCELTTFVVGDESSSGDNRVGQLKDLKAVAGNLKGSINIEIRVKAKRADICDWEGSCLEGAEHLQAVYIDYRPQRHPIFSSRWLSDDGVSGANDEAMLGKLVPHRNVTELELRNYMGGVKVPWWGSADCNLAALLPNLVTIRISNCRRLKQLPLLSKLKYLKSLYVSDLPELEYIDGSTDKVYTGSESKEAAAECTLFPFLESLDLYQKDLLLDEFRVAVSGVSILKSLPAGRLTHISFSDVEMESLSEVRDVFYNCSSLQSLKLKHCSKLVHLSGGLEDLTKLESLDIHGCGNLNWEEGDDDEGIPWRHLDHNLRSLKLIRIDNLKNLPKGMRYLTSLEELWLEKCSDLEALPEWISCLSSLQSLSIHDCGKLNSIPEGVRNMRSLNKLEIYGCSDELKEMCQESHGED